VYVEGRLSTRNWTGQDGTQKTTTEVVIDDMILLDSKQSGGQGNQAEKHEDIAEPEEEMPEEQPEPAKKQKKKETKEVTPENTDEEVAPDDIPF